MAQTTFRSEVTKGVGYDDALTISMVAKVTTIAVYKPVILADGSVTALPTCDIPASDGDVKVCGIAVHIGSADGVITAAVTPIAVVWHGFTFCYVVTADVTLNDPLETDAAGSAQVQPSTEISTVYDKADEVEAFNNIRASFAIALTQVSSGANSRIAVFVNIVPGVRVTAEA